MTLKFDDVYVGESACVVGPHEKNGPLKEYFDKCYDDFYMGEKSWERAESKLSSESIKILLSKTGLNKEDIDLIIAGDLSNQIASSCYAVLNYNIPFLGIYSACSTSTEGILLASLFVNSKNAKKVIVTVSSHNMASEKQFRNPTEYGAPKPSSSTFTATGGASILITNNNWREDKCDFQIYDKSTKLLLWVDEEGNTLNDFTENELLEDAEIENNIKPLIKRAYTSSAICVVC